MFFIVLLEKVEENHLGYLRLGQIRTIGCFDSLEKARKHLRMPNLLRGYLQYQYALIEELAINKVYPQRQEVLELYQLQSEASLELKERSAKEMDWKLVKLPDSLRGYKPLAMG